MKHLKCEMCGGTDLVKQDGIFQCQHCGAKYTVEEAKKMMIEGTVDVQGTVKVDNSDSIQNFYTMAASALEAGNQSEAENYCNKIIEIEPKHYEAWFLKGKAAGWQSSLAQLRIEESAQCFNNAIVYAPEEKKSDIAKQVKDEMSNLFLAVYSMKCNNFAEFPSNDNAQKILQYAFVSIKSCSPVIESLKQQGQNRVFNLEKIASLVENAVLKAIPKINEEYRGDDNHPNKFELKQFLERYYACINLMTGICINLGKEASSEVTIKRYELLISLTTELLTTCSWTEQYINGNSYWVKETELNDETKEKHINEIMEYHQKIKEINPEYVIPEIPTIAKKSKSKSGCYVATAIYGSYDCPQVWTLRRYRDNTLAKTWYGRAFIHTYYAISPTLVNWFGKANWFKNMWKPKLDRMVQKLQNKGIESTPYEDKNC